MLGPLHGQGASCGIKGPGVKSNSALTKASFLMLPGLNLCLHLPFLVVQKGTVTHSTESIKGQATTPLRRRNKDCLSEGPDKVPRSQAWWHLPEIPHLGRPSQEDCPKFELSLHYVVRPCCKPNKMNKIKNKTQVPPQEPSAKLGMGPVTSPSPHSPMPRCVLMEA